MKYCAKCSSILADADEACANCGARVEKTREGSGPSSQSSFDPVLDDPPPKYTVQGILVMLFCFTIGGVAALIYSGKIDKLFAEGRKEEAWKASETAKKWIIASVVISVTLGVLSFLVKAISGMF